MDKLRIGLIGCGGIGELRAQSITKGQSCRLTAVADADSSRAANFAVQHGAAADSDWTALLRRPDVDAVVISTPPASHAEIGVAAARAGKHILCEKPLARNPEECQQIIDAARENGITLATGFNFRFYPSVAKAREVLDSGVIGELDHVRSYTGYSAKDHPMSWLHEYDVMGGGTLRDNGIHLIDTTCYFFGDPTEVQGYGTSDVWKFPACEDNGFVVMRNKQGNVATVQSSWTEWTGYKFSVDIYGTKGCIRVRCFPMITEVYIGGRDAFKSKREMYFFPFVQVMEKLKTYRWVVVQSFLTEFEEFRKAIDGKKSLIASGHDGLRSVEIAHRATANSQLSGGR